MPKSIPFYAAKDLSISSKPFKKGELVLTVDFDDAIDTDHAIRSLAHGTLTTTPAPEPTPAPDHAA